jgi:hypothetical protein
MGDGASSGFGRGWIPAERDIGLPDEGARPLGLASSLAVEPPPQPLPAGAGLCADTLILPPLVPTRARADGWTFERQRTFLEALASSGSVTSACAAVGMSRESAYALRRRADGRAFAQAWDAARALAAEHLVDLAWDRATLGEVRQRFYHGEVVAEFRHYDNRLLLQLIAQNRAAAGRAVASPELVAAVAEDWEAALGRVERGEALAEPEPVLPEAQDERSNAGDIEPPLPREVDQYGDELGEAQQLNVGLYCHWWEEAKECWLTNWPAPADWEGEEFAHDGEGRVTGAFDPEAETDEWGKDLPPLDERWARTLTAAEEAALEGGMDREERVRTARLELYRRAAFGLASAAERASIASVNGGRVRFGAEADD